jgi:hypothetical protein
MIDFQQKRIEWICEFLVEPRSLESIMKHITEKVELLKLNEVLRNKGNSKRTIEDDLMKIRKGKFSFLNKFEDKVEGDDYFELKYCRKINKYAFSETSQRPIFASVLETETNTMPFIKGALEPYKKLPGVKKIIQSFANVYDVNNKKLSTKRAVVTSIKSTSESNAINELIINKTTELLSIIPKRKAITLMYSKVSAVIPKISNAHKFILFPFQVRIHDGIYYLIALDLVDDLVKNFRVDHIKSQIDLLDENDDENDELEASILKSYAHRFQTLRLNEDFFKYSFGTWCHNYPRNVYQITIAFYKWAASYVLIKPIHATQKIESVDENEVIISIFLNLQNVPVEPYVLEDVSIELAFELGRYRNNCEIKSITFEKEEKIRYHFL